MSLPHNVLRSQQATFYEISFLDNLEDMGLNMGNVCCIAMFQPAEPPRTRGNPGCAEVSNMMNATDLVWRKKIENEKKS